MPNSAAIEGTNLDAGDGLTLTGPTGILDINRTPVLGTLFYTANVADGSFFAADASFQLSGPGGPDVGAFDVALTAPGRVLSPTLDWLSTVDRNTDLNVDWTSEGGGAVFIELTQGFGEGKVSWVCRFNDDSQGTFPFATLQHFDVGAADLQVYRFNSDWFDAQGLDAPVQTIFGAEHGSAVVLQ